MTLYGWTFLGIVIVIGEVYFVLEFGKWRFRKGYIQGRADEGKWFLGLESEITAELANLWREEVSRVTKEMRG